MLQRLVEWKVEEKDNCLANYFEKVMRLFEQIPAPHYVIKVADSAILLLKNGHPKSVSKKLSCGHQLMVSYSIDHLLVQPVQISLRFWPCTGGLCCYDIES